MRGPLRSNGGRAVGLEETCFDQKECKKLRGVRPWLECIASSECQILGQIVRMAHVLPELMQLSFCCFTRKFAGSPNTGAQVGLCGER